MLTTTLFPGRYVQGPGAMKSLGEEIERFGTSGYVIVDPLGSGPSVVAAIRAADREGARRAT